MRKTLSRRAYATRYCAGAPPDLLSVLAGWQRAWGRLPAGERRIPKRLAGLVKKMGKDGIVWALCRQIEEFMIPGPGGGVVATGRVEAGTTVAERAAERPRSPVPRARVPRAPVPRAPLAGADPVARGLEAYRALVDSSLTVGRAARRLGVNTSRIRQRLGTSGDLYGFKVAGEWRIPAFQFGEGGEPVPGVGRVQRLLPQDLHPLAVQAWFARAHPDLTTDLHPDIDLSPRDWLAMGNDVSVPEGLARGFEGSY